MNPVGRGCGRSQKIGAHSHSCFVETSFSTKVHYSLYELHNSSSWMESRWIGCYSFLPGWAVGNNRCQKCCKCCFWSQHTNLLLGRKCYVLSCWDVGWYWIRHWNCCSCYLLVRNVGFYSQKSPWGNSWCCQDGCMRIFHPEDCRLLHMGHHWKWLTDCYCNCQKKNERNGDANRQMSLCRDSIPDRNPY